MGMLDILGMPAIMDMEEDIWAMLPLYIMLLPMLPLSTMLFDMEFPTLLTQSVSMVQLLLLCQLSMVLMQVLEDMLLTLQELFMLPSVKLRLMLSIPPMEWVISDMLDIWVMVLLILDMQLLPFIMESPMLLTLLVFTALLLLLSQLFMVPMQVLEDMLPTLLELFTLPNGKQRLILMLTTMHMDLGAMVLDTESILMDMAIILDTPPLDLVVVLDMDMVMDTMDKQKNDSLTPPMNEMSSSETYINCPLSK